MLLQADRYCSISAFFAIPIIIAILNFLSYNFSLIWLIQVLIWNYHQERRRKEHILCCGCTSSFQCIGLFDVGDIDIYYYHSWFSIPQTCVVSVSFYGVCTFCIAKNYHYLLSYIFLKQRICTSKKTKRQVICVI